MEQTRNKVVWWDVKVPQSEKMGRERELEDNALLRQELHNWLWPYSHNCGWQRLPGVPNQTLVNGEILIPMVAYVRFYHRIHAILFKLTW